MQLKIQIWLKNMKRQWGYAILLSSYLISDVTEDLDWFNWLLLLSIKEAEKEVAAALAERDKTIHDLQEAQSRHGDEIEAR